MKVKGGCVICGATEHYNWKTSNGEWVCGEHFQSRYKGVQHKKRQDIKSRKLLPDGTVGRFKDGKRIG